MRSFKISRISTFMLLSLFAIFSVTSCASGTKPFGVIFTREDSNEHLDIYKISDNAQGKIEQLTFTPTIGEFIHSASPDGTVIVFLTERYGASDNTPSDLAIERPRAAYMLDTVTKELTDITAVVDDDYRIIAYDFSMDCSPDQKQFMVVKSKKVDDKLEIFLKFMDYEGKNRKEVSVPIAGDLSAFQSAKWSPDGRKILLVQLPIGVEAESANPDWALLVYEVESKNIKQLTSYADDCAQEKWSPNSQQIVVSCSKKPLNSGMPDTSGSETIRIFNVENPGQTYGYGGFSSCYHPSWSPDGTKIVFVCEKMPKQTGIFIFNADGSGFREMNLGNAASLIIFRNPTWSPDGTQIVYVAGAGNYQTQIYSINLDGSNQVMLTKEEASYRVRSVYPVP